jgi:hypothetical protein
VEVQELACKAPIANVRFPLSRLLADNRGALIQRLGKLLGTTEFGWRATGVDVFSTDNRDFFRLTGRDLLASCEHFADFDATATKIRSFVEAALDGLEVERITFLGVRATRLATKDLKLVAQDHDLELLEVRRAHAEQDERKHLAQRDVNERNEQRRPPGP